MNLADWADLADIVGAIAVVLSLVYVALQIRQNTTAIKAGTHQEELHFARACSENLINNPELTRIVRKAEVGLRELSDEERFLFHEFESWRLAGWEHAYLQHQAGMIEDELWHAWDGVYRRVIDGKKGYYEFFDETRAQWEPSFMSHVESGTNV